MSRSGPGANDCAADAAEGCREPEVNKLFRMVMKHEASDLHLKVGQPPMMRLRATSAASNMRPLTQEDMERLLLPLLQAKHRKILDEEGGVDFSYVIGQDECRFRVSLFKQRGRLSLVARRVNNIIPNFEDLGLPPSIEKLCNFPEGLVILAGVTGSRQEHHHRLDARLHQRPRAAAHPHRRGPDRVHLHRQEGVHQPARDRPGRHATGTRRSRTPCARTPTSSSSASCATSTPSRPPSTPPRPATWCSAPSTPPAPPPRSTASSTCSRRTSTAPSARRWPTTSRPSSPRSCVKGLKKGRVPTNEIMIVNPTIRKLISEGEDNKLPDAIRIGYQEGMVDFTENLRQLVERGDIDKATALEVAPDPEQLKMAFKGIKVVGAGHPVSRGEWRVASGKGERMGSCGHRGLGHGLFTRHSALLPLAHSASPPSRRSRAGRASTSASSSLLPLLARLPRLGAHLLVGRPATPASSSCRTRLWNPILLGCGVARPGRRLAAFRLCSCCRSRCCCCSSSAPSLVYVSIRNERRRRRSERVLTAAHLRELGRRYLRLKFGKEGGRRRRKRQSPSASSARAAAAASEDANRVSRAEESRATRPALEMVYEAIELRATDIHMEPTKEEMTVRFRIDGILQPTPPFSRPDGRRRSLNIFKVLADLDITEKRKPQDGSFSAEVQRPKRTKAPTRRRTSRDPHVPESRRSISAWPPPAASSAKRWSCASSTAPGRSPT